MPPKTRHDRDPRAVFGVRLRILRQRAGLVLETLARKINVSKSVLNGKKLPIITGMYGGKGTYDAIRAGDVTATADVFEEQAAWILVDRAAGALGYKKGVSKKKYPFNALAPLVVTKKNAPRKGYRAVPPFDYVSFFKAKWKKEFGS